MPRTLSKFTFVRILPKILGGLPGLQVQPLRYRSAGSLWSAEEREKAASLQSQGHSTSSIAQILSRSYGGVYSVLHRDNNKPLGAIEKRESWNEAEDEKLVELWNQGLPVPQIARSLDRSTLSVTSHVYNKGVRLAKNILTFTAANGRPRPYLGPIARLRSSQKTLTPVRDWTSEDEELLLRLREGSTPRLSFPQIGTQMNRTAKSASARYRLISRGRPTSTFRKQAQWSEIDTETAIEMAASGARAREIAAVVGRTIKAVRQKIRSGSSSGPYRQWTQSEVSDLIKMRSNSATWDEIAARLGRSPVAVTSKYYNDIPLAVREAAKSHQGKPSET